MRTACGIYPTWHGAVSYTHLALAMIERLPSQSRKAFNYEAQIAKIEEEIERYQKLKLGLYENFIGGVIDKSEYFEFRNSYTKIIEGKQDALLRVKKEMKQTVTTGTTERNWVMLFKQYENVEELNRRVLMSLVDRILIHENHAIEIVFKYRDEYQPVSYTHLDVYKRQEECASTLPDDALCLCAEGFRPRRLLCRRMQRRESQNSRPLYIGLQDGQGNTACRTAQRLPAGFPSESSAVQGCPH